MDYTSQFTGQEIDERLSQVPHKVDKEEGKGLSTNDFTDEYKEKVDSFAKPYLSLERIKDYLYRVTFDSLPSLDNVAPLEGGCSAYVKDGKLYRNLDFKYDNAASFIIRTKDFEAMSFATGLNDGELDNDLIATLPYRLVDGRNNNGIMLSTHILFNDWEYTGSGDKSIPLTRLPFLVLSNVKSMATIESDLEGFLGNLNVEGMGEYLIQCLITDGTTTYALIPPTSDGEDYVLVDATNNPKMTNFRWVEDTQVERADLQRRPTGVERYNLMPCPLEELRFTKCYEAPTRLSEFIGIDGTTKDSTDAELEPIYTLARAKYLSRTRNGELWQTMHSVIYGEKMEELYVQEDWRDNSIKYTKPFGGIPSTDLSEGVRESLDKADTALQEHQSLSEYRKASEQDAIDNGKVDKVAGKGLSTNDYTNEEKAKLDSLENYDDSELRGKIADIEGVIPAQASDENQLADKAFVNSTVGTNTANYISDDGEPFTLVADLPTTGVTNNDYAFVTGTDTEGNVYFDRYKATVVGSTVSWAKEYRLNNSSFTANQWAAIQSGITSGLVAKLGALPTAEALAEALLAKYEKPTTGIPESDLSEGVKEKLNLKEVIYGYLYEGQFYEESSHTTVITPALEREYVDMTDATKPVPYVWNGEAYASMGGGGGDTTEIEQIASYAFNDLNRRVEKNTFSLSDLELIVSSALNDLEYRKLIFNNIAPEFHTWDNTIVVGDLRIYKGVLYKCNTQITYGNPFTPSEWTRTTIAEEMITTN